MLNDDHDDDFGSPPDLDGTEGLVDTAKLFAREGRYAEAAEYLESALALAVAAGDTRAIRQCWHGMEQWWFTVQQLHNIAGLPVPEEYLDKPTADQ